MKVKRLGSTLSTLVLFISGSIHRDFGVVFKILSPSSCLACWSVMLFSFACRYARLLCTWFPLESTQCSSACVFPQRRKLHAL